MAVPFYPADSAGNTAGSTGDVPAFEGRTCRGRSGQDLIFIPDSHLSVGTQVDQNADFFLLVKIQGVEAGRDVTADIGRDTRENVYVKIKAFIPK